MILEKKDCILVEWYRPLVARISQHGLRWGVPGPGGGLSARRRGAACSGGTVYFWGLYPSMQWGRPSPCEQNHRHV